MRKIGLIGIGNMGLAMVRGALFSKVFTSNDFLAYSRNLIRQREVKDLTGIDFTKSLQEIANCKQIIIATKPQDIAEVLNLLEKHITNNSLIVSIAAGVTLKSLKKYLKGKGHIIRVMPNTPIEICQGVSALAIGEECNEKDICLVKSFFSAMGKTFIVKEDFFDIVSALFGSGPAYFFYFIESMIDAAVKEGLDKKVACDMVIGTFDGAMQLLKNSIQDVSSLRKMVTSPKGSTFEAIKVFDKSSFFEIIHNAVKAAISRNKELGEI
ncbi:MAG: pyrroline-5-carboxylate reductase [Parachlamydiales bacterium]|jgi:pyrroline-5-carboxylate reductase